ncbi:ROK family protein [Micromonospora sp. M61]|uniref:ROK family protein n=1 Tax=Micromonospora sp. M61 TaxID=2824890 RepID=UPI001B381800|nr:ROK family protein [Micromonospora sp. M61]MBQ0977940.1 ROK family protein [Micromonospora sp. M61]
MSGPSVVVLDVGGTTLRSACFDRVTRTLRGISRVPTEGIGRYPLAPVTDLHERVVTQIVEVAGAQLRAHGAGAVSVAFAGPMTTTGAALAAPTIFGAGGPPMPVGELVRARLGVPVSVVNDLTAASWRYRDTIPAPFCLITVSSGIGNKVVWGDRVLVDPDGHGGELGHWRVDPASDAPICDCGQRGHLGALASGRAMQAAARRAAAADPCAFATSVLARVGPAEAIDNTALVAAIRAGDAFALEVLRSGLRHLATAITGVFTAIGVRRYVLIGGFAQAVGEPFVDLLREALAAAGCFGLDRAAIDRMVLLGEPDDDHGLIGAGRLMDVQLSGSTPLALAGH